MSTSTSTLNPFTALSLQLTEEHSLLVLNQQELPASENWIECTSPAQMYDLIKTLSVRGAPAIGVAAAVAMALFAETSPSVATFVSELEELRTSRPTAVNLMWALDRLRACVQTSEDKDNDAGSNRSMTQEEIDAVCAQVNDIVTSDRDMCEAMASRGAELIQDGESILTHCNTGGLATVGCGTALGVIAKAHAQGKKLHVYVDETRPLLQGGRLTTWELDKLGVDYTLICDNMAASLMMAGKIDRVLVGADRVCRNGDFANKIGTLNVALLCSLFGVPFHCVAPMSTVDYELEDGSEIEIEQRIPSEVRGVKGSFGQVCWAPVDAKVYNPAFDVTPAKYVSSIITDTGVFDMNEWATHTAESNTERTNE